MFGNLCTIVKIIVFDIVFPTADAIGDVTFSMEAFSNSHFLIGFAMSILSYLVLPTKYIHGKQLILIVKTKRQSLGC